MRPFSLLIGLYFQLISVFAQTTGTFIDLRDNKTYQTVTIGNQVWFAENLSYKATENCWSYNDDSTNIQKLGYLYTWKTALTVCPEGWHLPSHADWNVLIDQFGGESKAYKSLKKGAFNLNFAGYRSSDGTYHSINELGNWWSSTLLIEDHAWHRYAGESTKKIVLGSSFPTTCGFSVRCLKN